MNSVPGYEEVGKMRIKGFISFSKFIFILISGFINVSLCGYSQNKNSEDTVHYLNLDQCIVYALQHQPAMMQSAINIEIARKSNAISLSAWLPQVDFNGNLTHYDPLPTTFSANPANPNGPLVPGHSGIVNSFNPQVTATQAIINPEVLYAARSAHLFVQEAQQSNDSTKINLIATVSKSFYNLLFTLAQMNVLKDDTTRLGKTLRDAYHQYVSGVVDKTDYKEASISLNNSRAALKQATESVRPLYASLKQVMGFPPEKEFSVSYDTLQMRKRSRLILHNNYSLKNELNTSRFRRLKNCSNKPCSITGLSICRLFRPSTITQWNTKTIIFQAFLTRHTHIPIWAPR